MLWTMQSNTLSISRFTTARTVTATAMSRTNCSPPRAKIEPTRCCTRTIVGRCSVTCPKFGAIFSRGFRSRVLTPCSRSAAVAAR